MADEPLGDIPLGDIRAMLDDPEMTFAIGTVLIATAIWNVQHRHDWQDPDDDESYERTLHAAVALFNQTAEARGHIDAR